MTEKSWKVKENKSDVDDVLSIGKDLSTLNKVGNETSLKLPVEQTSNPKYNQDSVKLQLNIDAHASYDGQKTGKHYEWARAGSIVAVDSLDAPYLLEKRIKSQSCCNGSDVAVFLEIN